MVTACIIQARLGSTRLPAKVLLRLPNGLCVLDEVIERCIQIPGVDIVVVALPDSAENDLLQKVAVRAFARAWYPIGRIVRGPESDVLARYVKAAEAVNADIIIRITADCPLIDPEVCGELLGYFKERCVDYVSNSWPVRTFPHGYDCEIFTRELLDRAHAELPAPGAWVMRPGGRPTQVGVGDREHAGCTWMQAIPSVKRLGFEAAENRSHLRWTLDTLEDYVRIWGIFEEQMRARDQR